MEIRPGFHVAALPETLAAIREGEDFDLALAFVHIIAPGQPVRAGIRAAWCRPITLPDWSPYEPETRGRPALGNVHTAFVARWPISATLCPFLHCLEPDDQ
ncbi:hypothetical protein SAMN05444002_1975 [Vannielia litorea]|uniref:Uncharacterized protein n=2 Tax=Vannielia litorea TaxID=1217970 RepID=A0A1N6FUS4_9RHOB|nr:hypothetical protein SAMN05444002_1975 [Vannielia litorea]